ncbi:acyltransferase [Bradyrhizobium diazoefficiens]|uniref:acyltransferase family protein n=1 Tax=Bradyrhizobium diazoefficiens TaxID=1355477 RepID=UPI00190DC185|nr:acyltransferase [Bradyrhizobium diazoefficiens]QQO13527.1 acyltransferase [Bradyrhizobium diazoefficiens]
MSEKLHTLDGMRGVAAISVLFLHLGNWTEQRWFFTHGYLAVDFFFCLSGFVMAHAYGRRLAENMTFKNFLVQRVIRLYPVILLGMVLGGLYYLVLATLTRNPTFGAPDVAVAFGLNLFLIPFYFWPSALGGGIYPLNTPFWSIFFEMVANLIWARFLVRVSPVLLFASAAVLGLCLFPQYARIDGGGLIDQFWLGTLRVLVGFSAGLLVHNLYAEKRLDWISGINPWLLLAVLLGLFSVPNAGGVGYDMVCILLVFPLLTLLGARAGGNSGQALLEWLGAISYPLYGIHRPICLAMVFVIAPRLHLPQPLIVITGVIGSLCAAHVTYYYFDEPVRRILRSRAVAFKSGATSLAAS